MWPAQRLCDQTAPHDMHTVYSEPFDVRDVNDQVLYRVEERLLGTCRGVRHHVVITVVES